MQCPARYGYTVIDGLRGSRAESAYLRFHRSVYITIRWLEEERQEGRTVDGVGALSGLAAVWELTAPAGQSVNLRIALQRSAAWSMVSGMDWGSHPGIGNISPDWEAFSPATRPKAPAPKGVEAGDVHQDVSQQRLIYKCVLDPSVDNSG
jgi:hypothetical protein